MSTRAERSAWVNRVQELVQAWKEGGRTVAFGGATHAARRLCKELSDQLPSNAILVSDTGHSGIWTSTMLDLRHPGRATSAARRFPGLGLPAMGPNAAPDRPVSVSPATAVSGTTSASWRRPCVVASTR
ncbi:MAG: hypothetical protein R2932_23130 [Caldilineaceae bacterium]